MIIVTGAAGFIGSCLIKKLNSENFNAIVAVDKFDDEAKNKNLVGAKLTEKFTEKLSCATHWHWPASPGWAL